MTAVVSRAWGWARSWGSSATSENTSKVMTKNQKHGSCSQGQRRWTSWLWGGLRRQHDQSSPVEEYWEAQEKLPTMDVETLYTGKLETDASSEQVSRWYKYLPSTYLWWPGKTESSGLKQRKRDSCKGDVWDGNNDDYRTPPPSPTPPSALTSPFRLFAESWRMEILPEHHEICFNFLRHLFDLFVVGFLWTVSPPTKLVLEILGVHGALRLWLHGMAMFFVSTVGMAGLLWLIQEYLPQFALIYGIIQALVIHVSVRQSVILGGEEEDQENCKEDKDTDDVHAFKQHTENVVEKVKTS